LANSVAQSNWYFSAENLVRLTRHLSTADRIFQIMSKVLVPSRTSAWMMISLVILNPAFATTVVVLRGPDYVILGADSRVTDVNGDQTGSSSTCKIRQFDKVYFALAGPVGDGRGFDVFELAARIANGRTDVVGIADDFERLMRRPLTEYLQRFYGESPAQFSRYCANRICLQVAFVTVDSGTPKISIRGFFVTVSKKQVMVKPAIRERMDCPGTCATGAEQVLLGVNEEATSLYDRTPHFWKVNGIVSGMEQLIGAEISAHADAVGPPISILQLDSQGVRFIPDHQGLCSDPEK